MTDFTVSAEYNLRLELWHEIDDDHADLTP